MKLEHKLDAFKEAAKRYFNVNDDTVLDAFVFYISATEYGEITGDDLIWAAKTLGERSKDVY